MISAQGSALLLPKGLGVADLFNGHSSIQKLPFESPVPRGGFLDFDSDLTWEFGQVPKAVSMAFEVGSKIKTPRSCGFILGMASLFSEPTYIEHSLSRSTSSEMEHLIGFGGDLALSWLKQALKIEGPTARLDSACATGNDVIILAKAWLDAGLCDHCLVVCSSAMVNPIGLAMFANLKALNDQDEPWASCPFDQRRRGFVMGEGAAALLLSKKPGKVKLWGVGQSMNAYKFTELPEDTSAMQTALSQALDGVIPNYICAHGTATLQNDRSEAKLFQKMWPKSISDIFVSAPKSMTGHCLAASALIENILCIQALEIGKLPPTVNLLKPDPQCALNHVTEPHSKFMGRIALNCAFAFGGHNSAVSWACD